MLLSFITSGSHKLLNKYQPSCFFLFISPWKIYNHYFLGHPMKIKLLICAIALNEKIGNSMPLFPTYSDIFPVYLIGIKPLRKVGLMVAFAVGIGRGNKLHSDEY